VDLGRGRPTGPLPPKPRPTIKEDAVSGIQFPNALFNGNMTAVVNDNNGAPSNVIEESAPFSIDVSWSYNTFGLLGGQWRVQAFAESIGPGPEVSLGTAGPVPAAPDGAKAATIVVAANTLPKSPSGVYKIVTVLLHENPPGTQTNVAALEDGPLVKVI
jgi:hypothetical protein